VARRAVVLLAFALLDVARHVVAPIEPAESAPAIPALGLPGCGDLDLVLLGLAPLDSAPAGSRHSLAHQRLATRVLQAQATLDDGWACHPVGTEGWLASLGLSPERTEPLDSVDLPVGTGPLAETEPLVEMEPPG